MTTHTTAQTHAHASTAVPGEKPKTGRLATASMVGTTLEWYDFTVYNTMAALIFNHLFFPSFDPLTGTILAFSTYAVGYISRPIGGVIFGHLGDKLGRRWVLVVTLMLVGVVKLAPSLPLDGNYPYLHLDQKIMHLGFHIYDVGFQSPNVEAARPLVYATALLLVLVIATLNLSAVYIRNHLREKYKALDS